jgi:hypothetical protein
MESATGTTGTTGLTARGVFNGHGQIGEIDGGTGRFAHAVIERDDVAARGVLEF